MERMEEGTVRPPGTPRRWRLPRRARLRSRRDFQRIYREGVRLRGPTLLLVAAPGGDPATARLGMAVGRRYSRSAVVRNRTRRVFRETFRLLRPELPPLDLVLSPRLAGHRYRTPEVRDELVTLVTEARRRLGTRCGS